MISIIKLPVLILLLITLNYTNSFSQNSIDINLGYNFSNVSSKYGIDTRFYKNYRASLGYRTHLSERVIFNISLSIKKQGYILSDATLYADVFDPSVIVDIKKTYNNLTMPFMIGYKIGNKFTFTPKAGLFSGLIMNHKTIISQQNNNQTEGTSSDNSSIYLSLGIIFEFELSLNINDSFELFSSLNYAHELYSNPESVYHPYSIGSSLGLRYKL